jgi:hypothetical protein
LLCGQSNLIFNRYRQKVDGRGVKLLIPSTAMIKSVWSCTFTLPPRKHTNYSVTRETHAHMQTPRRAATPQSPSHFPETRFNSMFFHAWISPEGFVVCFCLCCLLDRPVVRVVSVPSARVQSDRGWPATCAACLSQIEGGRPPVQLASVRSRVAGHLCSLPQATN